MKWMIASDLHGSAYYCRKLLEAYDRENGRCEDAGMSAGAETSLACETLTSSGCDRLLLLGDILYHGPRNDLPRDYAPKEVIAMLNARKADIYNVRGNCDTEVDQMVLEFPVMTEYMLIPVLAAGADRSAAGAKDGNGRAAGVGMSPVIFATHGHIYNGNNLPPFHKGDILLHGHTHVPVCEDRGDYIYMNPGSVSIPKEGSWHGYMILEQSLQDGCRFTWKDLDGNVKKEFVLC